MQTRTARFGPDGQFDVGYSFINPYERYLITLQALPWVEAMACPRLVVQRLS